MKKVLGLLLSFLITTPSSFSEICDRPLAFEFETAGSGARLNDANIDWLKAHGISVQFLRSPEPVSQSVVGPRHPTEDNTVAFPMTKHHLFNNHDVSVEQEHATIHGKESGNSQVVFKFDVPMTVQKVGLISTDDTPDAIITLTMEGGRTMSFNVPPTAISSEQLVDVLVDKVGELTVSFPSGHGDVSSLNLCVSALTATTPKQRLRQALAPPPTAKPTNPKRLTPTDRSNYTKVPTTPPSTSSCNPIYFSGVNQGYSFQKGNLYLEWDPAIKLVSNQSSIPTPCSNVSYHAFLGPETFNYTNRTVAELFKNKEITYVRTENLELNQSGLPPNRTFSILVIASSSGDKSFSENRQKILVRIAPRNSKMFSNVSFSGLYEPSEEVSISFDKKATSLLFKSMEGLSKDIQALAKGMTIAVMTSDDTHHYFFIESVVATSSNQTVRLIVAERKLRDLFEELFFDLSFDAGKGYNQAVLFQKPGRRKMLSIGVSPEVEFDNTRNIGPLKVRGRITLGFYIRFTVNDLACLVFCDREAYIGVGAHESLLVSIQYDRAVTHKKEFTERLITGKNVMFGPWVVVIIPVWIDFQPWLNVKGSVSVKLEAALQVTAKQEAGFDAKAGYYNEGWNTEFHPYFSRSLTADVKKGKVEFNAEIGLILTLHVDVDSIVGAEVDLHVGLACHGQGSIITNPVLVQRPSIQPIKLSDFGVDLFFRVPFRFVSFIDDHDFGNIYENTWPLLQLPKFEIQQAARLAYCTRENAIELKAKITEQPYSLPIRNKLSGASTWWVDFNPTDDLDEGADLNGAFYKTKVQGNQISLQLPLKWAKNSTAYWLGPQPFDIPAGLICFRATPKIPPLPYSLVKCVEINKLFGQFEILCCSTRDCEDRFPSSKTFCNRFKGCEPSTPHPTFKPIIPIPPAFFFTPRPTPRPNLFIPPPLFFPSIPSIISKKPTPFPTSSPIVIPRRTSTIEVTGNSTISTSLAKKDFSDVGSDFPPIDPTANQQP